MNNDSVNIDVDNRQSRSPQKKSSTTNGKVSSPEKRIRAALQHQQSFDTRKAVLRQNSKIDDGYMQEYAKTEIIRKSV